VGVMVSTWSTRELAEGSHGGPQNSTRIEAGSGTDAAGVNISTMHRVLHKSYRRVVCSCKLPVDTIIQDVQEPDAVGTRASSIVSHARDEDACTAHHSCSTVSEAHFIGIERCHTFDGSNRFCEWARTLM